MKQPYWPQLTKRQNEVVCAVWAGHTTGAALAAHLVIDVRTVNSHLAAIYAYAEVDNMAALVLWCVRRGYKMEGEHYEGLQERGFWPDRQNMGARPGRSRAAGAGAD